MTPTFTKTATTIASAEGVHDLRTVEYRGAVMNDSDAEIRDQFEQVLLDRIVEALTKPAESSSSGSRARASSGNRQEVAFKGSADEVNRFYFEQGWSDGLPIVPPTVEKVHEFLKYTDRAPDEQIAVLPQANLRATPWNIAVNAVMAGCRPAHMPILIAAVEAAAEPDFQLMSFGTTGMIVPWLLVNGPIIKQLGIEYGVGLASRGPNPAIGRGFGFVIRNIAGFRPAETYMATWGYFPPFVFAEDEDACDKMGWKPYHVEHGFAKGASTVTVRSTGSWGPQALNAHGTDAKYLLDIMCDLQKRITLEYVAIPFGPLNHATVLITPGTASVLARAGYSKRDVATYVYENTTMPRRDANTWGTPEAGLAKEVDAIFKLPERYEAAGPDEMIPVFATAGEGTVDVVVCGDPYKDKITNFWKNYNKPVTKEIRLPASWEKVFPRGM